VRGLAVTRLVLRGGGREVGELARDDAALLGIAQDALGGVERAADGRVGQAAPARLIAPAGARVQLRAHQRRAELAGAFDRQALLAEFGHELVGERVVDTVGGDGAELADHHRQTPAQVADRLGAPVRVADLELVAVQPFRGHELKARRRIGGLRERLWWRGRPLAAVDLAIR